MPETTALDLGSAHFRREPAAFAVFAVDLMLIVLSSA